MPRTTTAPRINPVEVIANCHRVIANREPLAALDQMAIAIITQIGHNCESPSTFKREIKKVREALTAEFSAVPEQYRTTYASDFAKTKHKNFHLITKLSELSSRVLDSNNPDLRKEHYPEVLQRIDALTTPATPASTPTAEVVEVKVEVTRETTGDVAGEIDNGAVTETAGEFETKTETETETAVALDATALIDKATHLLNSEKWEDVCIGIALLTGRREVEAAVDMVFQAEDEYSLIISNPVKKATNDVNFEILCFAPSDDIEAAHERLKALTKGMFDDYYIHAGVGDMVQARAAFNNKYKDTILTRFNEVFRPLLDVKASINQKNSFKEMRSIYGAICREAKKLSYKPFSAKYEGEIVTFVKGCLSHESESATVHYGKWDVTNIPAYIVDATHKKYGAIETDTREKRDLVTLDVTTLERSLRQHPEAYKLFTALLTDKFSDPVALAEAVSSCLIQAAKNNLRENTLNSIASPSIRRGDITQSRVQAIIDGLKQHNLTSANKVFITESQIRAAYEYVYGDQVGFNVVKKIIGEVYGDSLSEHNKLFQLTAADNLKLRGGKIRDVYQAIKQDIHGLQVSHLS